MRRTKMERGITLVALILTIVILLILAVVAINAIINDDILGRADDATNKYNQSVENEQKILKQNENWLNNHMTGWIQEGNTIKHGDISLTVGQSIEYDETKNGEIKGLKNVEWKVIGAENGELLIMSTEDIGTKEIKGVNGYFNGINVLNDMCAVYGFGKGANGARSVNVNDINRVTGYSPEKTGNGEVYGKGQMYQYMNEVEINYDTNQKKFTMNGTNGVDANISYIFMLNSETNKLEEFKVADSG